MLPRFSCLLGRGERTFRWNSSLSARNSSDTTTPKGFAYWDSWGLEAPLPTNHSETRNFWNRIGQLNPLERKRAIHKSNRKQLWTTVEESRIKVARKAELDSKPTDTAEQRAAQLAKAVAYKAGRTTIFKYLDLWKRKRLDVLTPGDHMDIIHLLNFSFLQGRTTKLEYHPLVIKVANQAWHQFVLSGMIPTFEDHRQRIYVHSSCRDVNGMCTAWNEMKAAGHLPDYLSYLDLACCFSRSIDPLPVLDALKSMKANGLEPDCRIYAEVVRMHCAFGDRAGAERLLDGMLRTKHILDKISEGTLDLSPEETNLFEISGYGKGSRRDPLTGKIRDQFWNSEIAKVIQKFSNDGSYCLPPPNSSTFNPLIRAHRKAGDLDAIRFIHDRLKSENIEIQSRTYEYLIRAYAQTLDFESCLKTWHDYSPDKHATLSPAVYNSIIIAALKPKKGMIPNTEFAEQILELYKRDHQKRIRPKLLRHIEKAKIIEIQLTAEYERDRLQHEDTEKQIEERMKFRNEMKKMEAKFEAIADEEEDRIDGEYKR